MCWHTGSPWIVSTAYTVLYIHSSTRYVHTVVDGKSWPAGTANQSHLPAPWRHFDRRAVLLRLTRNTSRRTESLMMDFFLLLPDYYTAAAAASTTTTTAAAAAVDCGGGSPLVGWVCSSPLKIQRCVFAWPAGNTAGLHRVWQPGPVRVQPASQRRLQSAKAVAEAVTQSGWGRATTGTVHAQQPSVTW